MTRNVPTAAASQSYSVPDDGAASPVPTSQAEGNVGQPAAAPDMAEGQVGIGGRIKRFFLGDKLDKEKLKTLGECRQGVVSSFAGLDNMNARHA